MLTTRNGTPRIRYKRLPKFPVGTFDVQEINTKLQIKRKDTLNRRSEVLKLILRFSDNTRVSSMHLFMSERKLNDYKRVLDYLAYLGFHATSPRELVGQLMSKYVVNRPLNLSVEVILAPKGCFAKYYPHFTDPAEHAEAEQRLLAFRAQKFDVEASYTIFRDEIRKWFSTVYYADKNRNSH